MGKAVFLVVLGLVSTALSLPTGEISPPATVVTSLEHSARGSGPDRLWSTNCGNYGFLQRWYFPGAAHARSKRQAFLGGGIAGNVGGGSASASSSASSAAAAGGGITSAGGIGYPYAAYGYPYGYPFYGAYLG